MKGVFEHYNERTHMLSLLTLLGLTLSTIIIFLTSLGNRQERKLIHNTFGVSMKKLTKTIHEIERKTFHLRCVCVCVCV